jgi:hypothetical protein
MDMPDGWKLASPLTQYWSKGDYVVMTSNQEEGTYEWHRFSVDLVERGFTWRGGFPDPVSCAVACELATGGCTDGHA